MITCKQFFSKYYNKLYNDSTLIYIYKGGLDNRVARGHWFNDSIMDYLTSVRFEVSYCKREDFMNGCTRLDIVIDRI